MNQGNQVANVGAAIKRGLGYMQLTERQKAALKKHAAHHTAKHMAAMRAAMRRGQSFQAAHAQAQRKVGK